MLYGVTIDGIDTLRDFGLILCADLKISRPKLKENRVDIPGGDGSLNMSYSPQGYPVYKDRTISFSLFKAMGEAERSQLVSLLNNKWQGREVKIVLPDDEDHYWKGTIEFGDINGYNSGKIPVSMTAYPYKLRARKTVKGIQGNGTVTLRNERMQAIPTIANTAPATLSWEGKSIALEPGEHIVPELMLLQGNTEITVVTTGEVSFTYREGSL